MRKRRILKFVKRTMIVTVIIIAAVVLGGYIFMQQAQFGQAPSGERLERIKLSPNYKDGQFVNLSHTPDLTEGAGYMSVMWEFLFRKSKRNIPATTLPSKKVDLFKLDPDENILVWFGHSSYYIQVDGKKILVDPVFSGNASPLSFTTKSFEGTDRYDVEDFPEIDYLFISHDHWDHLDYKTVSQLKNQVGKVVTGLGTGAHLEHWGYEPSKIIEMDWNEETVLDSGFVVNVLPARHFSGRGLKRNGSLWVSFALSTPSLKIYLGGDSGYDTHFKTIGEKHGPFDFAILENGQYDKSWKYIHMMPEEVAQATIDLNAKVLIPVHWSKFSLGNHAWDDPIIRVSAACLEKDIRMITPLIGEEVKLGDTLFNGSEWWTGLE